MDSIEAKTQLITGYIIAGISFIAGLFFLKGAIGGAFLTAYVFWGTYWGTKIVYKSVAEVFGGVTTYHTSIFNAIQGHYIKQLWFYGIVLGLGYFVGVLGGGIYKQIQLMR